MVESGHTKPALVVFTLALFLYGQLSLITINNLTNNVTFMFVAAALKMNIVT